MEDRELLQAILAEIQGIKGEISTMNSRLEKVEDDTREIRLTLENETNVNIRRVAEGHLDLSRNLHEAMRRSAEYEMLVIKVNHLETEMRDLKRKIS